MLLAIQNNTILAIIVVVLCALIASKYKLHKIFFEAPMYNGRNWLSFNKEVKSIRDAIYASPNISDLYLNRMDIERLHQKYSGKIPDTYISIIKHRLYTDFYSHKLNISPKSYTAHS